MKHSNRFRYSTLALASLAPASVDPLSPQSTCKVKHCWLISNTESPSTGYRKNCLDLLSVMHYCLNSLFLCWSARCQVMTNLFLLNPTPLSVPPYIAGWEGYWDVLPQKHNTRLPSNREVTTPPNSHPDGSPILTLTGDQNLLWWEPNTHPDGNNSSSSSTTVKWRINSRPFCSARCLNEKQTNNWG